MKLGLPQGGALNIWKENTLGRIENKIKSENSAALVEMILLDTAVFLNTSAFIGILQPFLLHPTRTTCHYASLQDIPHRK